MKEPKPMQEIHEIQKKLYQEEKKLPLVERMQKRHREASEAIRAHGTLFGAMPL